MNSELSQKQMLCKVPEITMYFWVIKVLCTTVGETAADYLDVSLNFGLTVTSIIMGVLLAGALVAQWRAKKYVPGIYWLSVFLISIFGTLVTDNLTDSLGVPLVTSTIIFSILLALTFAVWYARERTLSIHSIVTRQREAFYWLAILFTFALGTASGDLMAEGLGLGYLVTGAIVAVMIISVIIAWKLRLDTVLSFWVAYILTRPLGASIGDYLSQSPTNGGLGLGPTITTLLFVAAILLTVIYLSITKKDQIVETAEKSSKSTHHPPSHIAWQIVGIFCVLALLASGGYFISSHTNQQNIPVLLSPDAPLGDLSAFKKISEDTLSLVREGKLADAKTRVADLEFAWDNAQSQLKPLNSKAWSTVDDAIDEVLRQLRAFHPDAKKCEDSLSSLIEILQ